MNLVRRILIDQRVALSLIGALVLIDLILYGAALNPLRAGVAKANARAAAASEAVVKARSALTEARAILQSETGADRQLDIFYSSVLPGNLAGAREIMYPTLAALATETSLVLERRTSVRGQDENSRLGWLRTTMRLVGDYRNIRRFMESLESGPHFVVIEEVALGQSQDGIDSSLILSLTVATYFRVRDGV